MVYDAAGQRLIRRDPSGATTLYLPAIELRLANGQVSGKRYYRSSDGALIALREPGGLTWLLAGLHGSTQLAVNATTGTITRERYLPFGHRRGTDDLPFTDLGFLGKTEDPTTGLTYLGARYYDPAIAKFISTDPELDLRTPEWANPYSYAANSPIDKSDPDGRRVDAGGGSSDKSYGYSRDKNRPNANQNFAETHHASGKKKTARERKIHKKRIKANEKRRAKRWKEANRKRFREDALRKQADMDYLTAISGLMAGDDRLAMVGVNVPVRNIRSLNIRVPSGRFKPFKSNTKRECSSFVPGTRVLMADGTTKPIEDVKADDKVLATDPKTGTTTAKPVTTHITSKGIKNLVRLSVGRDGAGAVIATGEHPFWVPTIQQWNRASALRPGQLLWVEGGTYTKVSAATLWTTTAQRVHNLTVAGTHTYYVLAGTTPVLVHNSDCPTHKRFPSRNAAFREAKRDLGIPVSQQAESVRKTPMTNREGHQIKYSDGTPIQTREYIFVRSDGSRVIIQDHSAGHFYNQGGVGDQGPHLNVRPIENPRTGKVPGTAQHYEY